MSTDLPIQMLDRPRGRKSTGKTAKKSVIPANQANVLLRMPKELKETLKCLAKADNRSLSNFIAWTVQAAVENLSINEHGVIVHHIPASRK